MCNKSKQTLIVSNGKVFPTERKTYKLEIVWKNVFVMSLLHICALYGVWITLMTSKWQTIFAMYFFGLSSAIGVLAGAHRLWSHRAYKAKWQLRVGLIASTYFG